MYHIIVLRTSLEDGKKNVKEGLGILVRVDLSGLTTLPSDWITWSRGVELEVECPTLLNSLSTRRIGLKNIRCRISLERKMYTKQLPHPCPPVPIACNQDYVRYMS